MVQLQFHGLVGAMTSFKLRGADLIRQPKTEDELPKVDDQLPKAVKERQRYQWSLGEVTFNSEVIVLHTELRAVRLTHLESDFDCCQSCTPFVTHTHTHTHSHTHTHPHTHTHTHPHTHIHTQLEACIIHSSPHSLTHAYTQNRKIALLLKNSHSHLLPSN